MINYGEFSMTNQEILTKAIEKSIAAGCKYFDTEHYLVKHYVEGIDNEPAEWPNVNDIIFNHDFAKSLVGTDMQNGQPRWKNFLQYLVVQDDPIKALEKFL